jgi:hypothetical protein
LTGAGNIDTWIHTFMWNCQLSLLRYSLNGHITPVVLLTIWLHCLDIWGIVEHVSRCWLNLTFSNINACNWRLTPLGYIIIIKLFR